MNRDVRDEQLAAAHTEGKLLGLDTTMAQTEQEADSKAQQASLDSLEDAAGKGDVAKTCSLLNILRQQYTEQPRKQWSADTVRSLWSRVLETMKVMQSPEVCDTGIC